MSDMVADRSPEVKQAVETALVKIDDLKFHRDEAIIATLLNGNADRNSGVFNDLSVHDAHPAHPGLKPIALLNDWRRMRFAFAKNRIGSNGGWTSQG
ncbi:hypothetical protein J2T09_001273 [Neorhizobium huautlense]|uniref:Uncharacterized protein n=1 Tax=Neorhizobium huautlense TaxID=67774 RepID=A0ABT9PS36_9HYPH|nr:hypothetical protein [Neorhizobium huautlense]MDP9836529.1 hypothetical protein [Neorhizobium huautlense]